MTYCLSEDIIQRILRRFPNEDYLPAKSRFTLHEPARHHAMSGWWSIGLQREASLNRWAVLAGIGNADGFQPCWDVYGDREELEAELGKACKEIGGAYAVGH